MGNFDSYTVTSRRARSLRSALRSDVGPDAINAPEDLHVISRTLASAGLLDEHASPILTHSVIFNAIRHARQTFAVQTSPDVIDAQGSTITPGDSTERAMRHALSSGRLALSHRAVAESTSPKGTRSVLDGGMRRALSKLKKSNDANAGISPHSRTLLPNVSSETFHANRRLADALEAGGDIVGLEELIARTLIADGKQGYSDVKDFMDVLKQRAPKVADDISCRITSCLEGTPRLRFRKLTSGEPPIEADFR